MNKTIVVLLISGTLIAALLPWVVFPVLNDKKAIRLKHDLQSAILPSNTIIVEVISGCGNTTRTGDHTEILTAILIKTDASEEKILEFYDKKLSEDYQRKVLKVDSNNKETWGMSMLNIEFQRLKSISEYEGYYIIERIDDAVSSFFDIRGS